MKAQPLSPRETKDSLLRLFDGAHGTTEARIDRIADEISRTGSTSFHRVKAVLTDALIERGDLPADVPDTVPVEWSEEFGFEV
jgi:hypothetical protein